jgi:pyridoxine 5-phosphate synthase
MVKLSVNINKIALIRNARGGGIPNLLEAALRIESFGAHGITVHPRPDQRHITFADVRMLKREIKTELNVEGFPSKEFIDLVCEVKPDQVTLVPDAPEALTSNAGWDCLQHDLFLKPIIAKLKSNGIRTSLFMDTDTRQYSAVKRVGADRIELYTEAYAQRFDADKEGGIKPYIEAARVASELALGLNAGHDLNSQNLAFFAQQIPGLLEVSIGHALISEALYLGLENTVKLYLNQLP